jgi:hypothetical protein
VVTHAVLEGRDAEAWGYEWLGPIAMRIDALEAVLATPSRVEQVFDQLGLDAATRGIIVKQLRRIAR